jgi:hypothetical protein
LIFVGTWRHLHHRRHHRHWIPSWNALVVTAT